MDLAALSEELLAAIEAEKRAVRQALGAVGESLETTLFDGTREVAEPGAHLYRFAIELDHALPEGANVRLQAVGVLAAGEIVEHDPDAGWLRCLLREDLGDEVPRANLGFDASFLLDLLAKRIENIADESAGRLPLSGGSAGPNVELALALLAGRDSPGQPVAVDRPGLSPVQRRVIEFALGQRIAYLWGPPGTGKTRAVAHLVHELIARGERVVLAAHTNAATDTALSRVLEAGALPPEAAVRVGFCPPALHAAGVGLDDVVDGFVRRTQPELAESVTRLCSRLGELEPRAERQLGSPRTPLGRRLRIARELLGEQNAEAASELRPRLGELARSVEAAENEVLARASVVATTLTRLYTSRALSRLRTDALIIDEASVASLAICYAAGCLAGRRIVAVGDFRQLPTIVQSKNPLARRWLGRSVFASAGCDRVDASHPLRTMLVEQWRMHPRISRLVSQLFYGGKLRDAEAVSARAHEGPAVLLLDTSRFDARSESTRTGSKRNPLHAELVADLVRRAPDQRIAVIAPYRAQVRAAREVVRKGSAERLRTGQVEVFTVHRFQGRDAQLVVFDLVEAPGTRCTFLDELRNPDAACLINVALSRARQRLVLVCHLEHLSAALGRQALVNRVFALARVIGCLELQAGHAGDRAVLERFLDGEG